MREDTPASLGTLCQEGAPQPFSAAPGFLEASQARDRSGLQGPPGPGTLGQGRGGLWELGSSGPTAAGGGHQLGWGLFLHGEYQILN